MSVNGHLPHVLVLPEDDANRQLANGFVLDLDQAFLTRIQVLEVAGGWTKVLERFLSDEVAGMGRFPQGSMVLLIDFDGQLDRVSRVRARIPEQLTERVYILGALTEPEDLKKADLGSYETIGRAMAQDCRDGTNTTWGHDLLQHNASELERLRERVRSILFP
jgi:hypothetical protein